MLQTGYTPYRKEIDDYCGKYHRMLLNTLKPSQYREKEIKQVEAFLSAFPEKRQLSEYTCIDLNDYLIALKRRGYSDGRLRKVRQSVARFWSYLREIHRLPYKPMNTHAQLVRRGLRPEFVATVLSRCKAVPELYIYLVLFLLKKEPLHSIDVPSYGVALRRWRYIVRSLGFPLLTMARFRSQLRTRVWGRDIIQSLRNEYDQLCNSCIMETKTCSQSLTNIQLPTGDVRPPVSDGSKSKFMIAGID